MRKVLVVLFIALIIIGVQASDYVIEGDSVYKSDSQASIRVTPYLAQSPVGDYKQTAELCNTTGADTTLYGAYIFNQPLQSGAVKYWKKPVYEWVESTRKCDYEFDYVLNQNLGRNPHYGWCWRDVDDGNSPAYSVPIFEHEFKTGGSGTIRWDENTLVAGNIWTDVTNSFTENYTVRNGKHIYPYIDGLPLKAHSCETWSIEYIPGESDTTEKWELCLWAGSDWACILNDTCDKTLKMDPWWDSGDLWLYKKKITLKTTDINMAANITNDHTILVDINADHTDFWANVAAAGEDVRFVNAAEDGEYSFYFQDFNNDTDEMLAWVLVTDTFTSGADVDFYLYYGNGAAANAEDALTTLADYNAVYHMDQFGGTSSPDAKGQFNATASNAAIWDNSVTARGGGSSYCNALYYTSQPTLWDFPPAERTISFWFKTDIDPPTANRFIWGKDNTGGNYRQVTWDAGKILEYGAIGGSDEIGVGSKSSWATDTWYFFISSRGSAGLYTRIDADTDIIRPDFTGTWQPGTNSDFVMCDRWYDPGTTEAFDGYVDEFKVYGIATNSDEMELIYQSEAGFLQEYGAEEIPAVPIFSDFNLFEANVFDVTVDLNSASDSNIAIDFNITIGDINQDATRVYFHIATIASDSNCFRYIRDQPYCGWWYPERSVVKFDTLASLGNTYQQRSSDLYHDFYVYSATNLDFNTLANETGSIVLNNSADWVKVLITNTEKDANVLNLMHFDASYTGPGTETLNIWDCNNDVVNPDGNIDCAHFSIDSTSPLDASGDYSISYTTNDLNQIPDGNLAINSDGNHWYFFNCASCGPSKYWSMDTVPDNSNIDRDRHWTSNTGVGTLVADNTQSTTVHASWINLNKTHYFDYFVQVFSADGLTDTNSAMQREEINIVNLPPVVQFVAEPVAGTIYSGIIDINVHIQDALVNPIADGVRCDINLLNVSSVAIDTVAFNLTPIIDTNGGYVCTTTYDTTGKDGNHFLYIMLRETTTIERYTANFTTGAAFILDNMPDLHRYFKPGDPRVKDTARYFAATDLRSKKLEVQTVDGSTGEFIVSEFQLPKTTESIPLYLTILLIILAFVWIVFKR